MTCRRSFVASLLFASGLIAALPASSADCSPMGGWGQFREQRTERMEQRQKSLHDALKLSPDQEAGWRKYAETVRPMPPIERPDPADMAKLTAPERAEKMLDLSRQRHERMAEHVAALKTFYAALTPEQKKIFDEQQPGPRPGRRGMPPSGDAAPTGKN